VRLHLGTADLAARIVAPGGAVAPGSRTVARLVLDTPAAARAGDRFVLRAPAPLRTIGGGVILDPLPEHRRKRPAALPAALPDRLGQLARDAGRSGIPVAELPVRLGVAPADVSELVERADVVRVGGLVAAEATLEDGAREAARIVAAFHEASPLEPGMPVQELRARIGGASEIVEAVLQRAVSGSALRLDGASAMRADWTPRLPSEWHAERERLLDTLRASGREPPSVEELTNGISSHAFSILKFLEREGRVVQVSADRFYDPSSLEEMVSALRQAMKDGGEWTPQQIRDVIGLSRKFLIPFLEFCDRNGVTERRANGRVLAGAFRGVGRQVLA
jgi:selenocysteine-specific elongation factor